MLRGLQGWHLIILIVLLIVLFGWKRLPDAARSMGRSMRVFKSEVDQMKAEAKGEGTSAAANDTVTGTTLPKAQEQGGVVPPNPVSENAPRTDNHS